MTGVLQNQWVLVVFAGVFVFFFFFFFFFLFFFFIFFFFFFFFFFILLLAFVLFGFTNQMHLSFRARSLSVGEPYQRGRKTMRPEEA